MTLEEIRAHHRARFEPCTRWLIVEINGRYEVHVWTVDGVAPPSTYDTKRQAAARLLQLLKIGPVRPQTWPEEVCIGYVENTP